MFPNKPMNAIEAAEHAGFDMSLIEESLRCTPEQRALQHQAALEMALQLEAAYQSFELRSPPHPAISGTEYLPDHTR